MNKKWIAFSQFRAWLSNLIGEADVNECQLVRYRFIARKDDNNEFESFDMHSFGEVLRRWDRWNNAELKSKLQCRYGLTDDDGEQWKDYDVMNGPCVPRY